MIDNTVLDLLYYGEQNGLFCKEDRNYVANRIIEVMEHPSFLPDRAPVERALEEILAELLNDAAQRGLIDGESIVERDLMDTKLMGAMMPRPSQVIGTFWQNYQISPEKATDYYYKLSQDSDYIRRYRICKDMRWKVNTDYGEMDITINLSKPEKDPKSIAAARNVVSAGYPKCLLCKENEGYAGRIDAPARQNHRIIPLTLNGEAWNMQYSPYVYYNEHCIVFNAEHTPMKISKNTFARLLDFVDVFPHYFIGSNADLPLVGGSILTHDHFQGGRYQFAMERAPIEKEVTFEGYEDVSAGIVHWPLSVLRLRHADAKRLVSLGGKILDAWRNYTDEQAYIFAHTDGVPHNTITPVARRVGQDFELDLVLRNNITTEQHPMGLYHPHAEHHHLKKENIGVIEVMGLAVLPARLQKELADLGAMMVAGEDISADPVLGKHAAWAGEIMEKYGTVTADTINEILQQETGAAFANMLEHSGVYKCTAQGREAFLRFVKSVK